MPLKATPILADRAKPGAARPQGGFSASALRAPAPKPPCGHLAVTATLSFYIDLKQFTHKFGLDFGLLRRIGCDGFRTLTT